MREGPLFFLIAYFCRLFFDLNNKESSSLGNKERSLFDISGPSDNTLYYGGQDTRDDERQALNRMYHLLSLRLGESPSAMEGLSNFELSEEEEQCRALVTNVRRTLAWISIGNFAGREMPFWE